MSGARQSREDAPAVVIGREAVAAFLDEHLRDGDVARGHAAQQRRLTREIARVDEAEILVASRLLDEELNHLRHKRQKITMATDDAECDHERTSGVSAMAA